jgi:hypothetical protein
MAGRASIGALLAGMLLLAACATGGGETPRRPATSVVDEAGAVDRAAVVGTWQCRELNPYPEVPQVATTTTYRADGTFTSEGRSAPRPPLGPMRVEANGRWSVEGGEIVTSEVTTEASSEDAWTNLMAGVGAHFIDLVGGAQDRVSVEVLKLSRGELVVRPSGVEDPAVIACAR